MKIFNAAGNLKKAYTGPATGITFNDAGLVFVDGATVQAALEDIDAALADDTGTGSLVRATGGVLTGCTGRITHLTAQATTSGSSVDFTVPTTAKAIFVGVSGVSSTTAVAIQVQIGDAGGVETSGYDTVRGICTDASVADAAPGTGAFAFSGAFSAAMLVNGSCTLVLVDSSANTWSFSGQMGVNDTTDFWNGCGGAKSLSAAITTVRVLTTGTFDAGIVNVSYID